MTLYQKADADEARTLIEKADEVLKATTTSTRGSTSTRLRDGRPRGAATSPRSSGSATRLSPSSAHAVRKDLEGSSSRPSPQNAIISLDVVEAESLAHQATELAEASGSVRARAAALGTQAWLAEIQGPL
jgi:hypothetical protein